MPALPQVQLREREGASLVDAFRRASPLAAGRVDACVEQHAHDVWHRVLDRGDEAIVPFPLRGASAVRAGSKLEQQLHRLGAPPLGRGEEGRVLEGVGGIDGRAVLEQQPHARPYPLRVLAGDLHEVLWRHIRLCIEKQPAGADIAALARKPQRCHDGAVGPDLAPDVDVGARLDKRAGALLARMAVASHMHHQSAVQQRDLPRDARQRDELRQLGATRLPHQLPEPARLPTPENQRQLGGSDGRLRQLVPGAASGQLGWFGAQVGRPDREPAHAGGRADLHAIPPPALVEAEDPGDSPVELRSRLQTHHRGAQARRQASAVVICRAERVLCA
mmetsp:Transcript_18520/g.60137  ORF Transcript_18520/g.60137 Transcript_18520/m.60137 type:complete len:333 (-) Transcript_18520:919-1917(-)